MGNWPQVDEGDPGCDADGDVACVFFARGMITGRSEASTELCSGEPTHVSGEIATAGGGGREGKDVDVDARPGGEPLVDGVASSLGGRRGLAVGERKGGIGTCEPLGVKEDGRAGCLRAPCTGIGGASGGSGRRVGVRMRVLRDGLNEDE